MRDSKYLVALSVDNEDYLKNLYNKLKLNGANVVAFTEPDIDN
jgi:chaperonin GroEL (HSP60 family)